MRRVSASTRSIGNILVLAGLGGIGGHLLYSSLNTQDDSWQAHVVTPLRPLKTVGDDLWQITAPLRPGSDVERNMVIYRLPNKSTNTESDKNNKNDTNPFANRTFIKKPGTDELLLHSVIALDDATMKQIESLGKPSVIIVPSPSHRADAAVYKRRYPNARVICPKEIVDQVSEKVPVDGTASQVLRKEYGITCLKPKGGLRFPELAYELPYHEGGRNGKKALVFCDLLVNLRTGPWYMKLMQGVTGGESPRMSLLWKRVLTKDRHQMKEFWKELADRKDIGALLMAHGDPYIADPETISKTLGQIAEQL